MSQFTVAVRRHFNTDPFYHVDEFVMLKPLCKPPVVFITKQQTPNQFNTKQVYFNSTVTLRLCYMFSSGMSTQNIQRKTQQKGVH
jgi:hypothetical protein